MNIYTSAYAIKKQYQDVSDLFGLLAHTPRLKILDELRRGEACVCHLQAALGRPQTYMSQQLRMLRDADVVSDRRDGLYVYYRLTDPRVERLLEQTLGPAGEPERLPRCCCPTCEPECSVIEVDVKAESETSS